MWQIEQIKTHTTDKANYLKRGSGIGLAIVDEIVALHGGKLNIISEESFGTTVTIELPIYNED